MKVREIMTPSPVCVEKDVSVDEAVRTMEENRIRHLPVLDKEGLVGVVSDRDLLQATGWLPARVRDVFDPKSRELRVSDVVQTPAVTVGTDVGVVSACLDMIGRSIGCLPVVDGEELVGVISEMDVLAFFVRECGGTPLDIELGKTMATGVATISEEATLEQAAELMLSMGVRHLPVVDRERLIGMLSDRDVHRAAGSGRSGDALVDEIMARDVSSLPSSERLSRAAETMIRHRFSAIPVVDDDRLEGLVTITDVLDHCLTALRDPTWVGEPKRA
jgi:acetoin utilization protein AcuB